MEKVKSKIGELLKKGYEILKSVGIDSYQLDCELLLGKVIEKDRLFMLINREYEVSDLEAEKYFQLVEKRKNKMPIKYMLGECEFMGMPFYIKEGVLIPRPDTEVLVESAIEEIKKNKFKNICDVCCGSGIIGISIAKLVDNIKIKSCDISDIAYEVTKENVNRLSVGDRVQIFKSDLLECFIGNGQKFDMIVSNPPYIRPDVIETLMEDVKDYEPYEALYGGEDGLEFYRKITFQSIQLLNKGGLLIFEIGHDQKEAVTEILKENGFGEIKCIKDLAEKDRVIKGKLEICC
ncbi:peptide chain release factor N(5)-glutamine methyltransferase [Clostridium magnum]|uniref:Release factor glutamine methyltransferase n=1 Tax=Clostridium magnum DSM 2767 TaxID=1121326 RepID=A0A162RL91_9CLOT|nr:peptide chain release factor N(5)-glutamine methyltransferase [Clostridium magnum]KZL90074.1 release factor glutamine methyltransferase [Clostridium magnum DSM 2767]SHH59529.1 release factor glutamine methyltransferase [Clostridium magnum DSM 2767]